MVERFSVLSNGIARFGIGVLAAGLVSVAAPVGALSAEAVANPAAGVPKPAGVTAQVDPACKKTPAPGFCNTRVQYTGALTTVAARNKWAPLLKTWKMTTKTDTCVSKPTQAATFCVIHGTRSGATVTLVFNGVFEARYAPNSVKSQVAAIQSQANKDAAKAKTAAARSTVLNAAKTKIATVKRTATAYNKAHPKSLITVSFTK